MPRIELKWGSRVFPDIHLDIQQLAVPDIKAMIEAVTGVPPGRQKLMCRTGWKGILRDNADLSQVALADGTRIILMGTVPPAAAAAPPAPAPQPQPEDETQPEDEPEDEYKSDPEDEEEDEEQDEPMPLAVPQLTVLPSRVAFLMSGHPRLGRLSAARRLSPYLRRAVLEFFEGGVERELEDVEDAGLLLRVAETYDDDAGVHAAVLERAESLFVLDGSPTQLPQVHQLAVRTLARFAPHRAAAVAALSLLTFSLMLFTSRPDLEAGSGKDATAVPLETLLAVVPAHAADPRFADRWASVLAQLQRNRGVSPSDAQLPLFFGTLLLLLQHHAPSDQVRGALFELVATLLGASPAAADALQKMAQLWAAVPGEQPQRPVTALRLAEHVLRGNGAAPRMAGMAAELARRYGGDDGDVARHGMLALQHAEGGGVAAGLLPLALEALQRFGRDDAALTRAALAAMTRCLAGDPNAAATVDLSALLETVDGLLSSDDAVLQRVLRLLSVLGSHAGGLTADGLVVERVVGWLRSGRAASELAACRALELLYDADDVGAVRAGAVTVLVDALEAGVQPQRVAEALATFRHHRPDVVFAGALVQVTERLLLAAARAEPEPGFVVAAGTLCAGLCTVDVGGAVFAELQRALDMDRPGMLEPLGAIAHAVALSSPEGVAAHAETALGVARRLLERDAAEPACAVIAAAPRPMAAAGAAGLLLRPRHACVFRAMAAVLPQAAIARTVGVPELRAVCDACLTFAEETELDDPAAVAALELLQRTVGMGAAALATPEMADALVRRALAWCCGRPAVVPEDDIVGAYPALGVVVAAVQQAAGAVPGLAAELGDSLPRRLATAAAAPSRTAALFAVLVVEAVDCDVAATVVELQRLFAAHGLALDAFVTERLGRRLSAPRNADRYLRLVSDWATAAPSPAALAQVLRALSCASPDDAPLSAVDVALCSHLGTAARVAAEAADRGLTAEVLRLAAGMLERDARHREGVRTAALREAQLTRELCAAALRPGGAAFDPWRAHAEQAADIFATLGGEYRVVQDLAEACGLGPALSEDLLRDLDHPAAQTACVLLALFPNAAPALERGFVDAALALLDTRLREHRDTRGQDRIVPWLANAVAVRGRGREVVARLQTWADAEHPQRDLCRAAAAQALELAACVCTTPAVLLAAARAGADWLRDPETHGRAGLTATLLRLLAAVVGGADVELKNIQIGNRGVVQPPTGHSRNLKLCAEAVLRAGGVPALASAVARAVDRTHEVAPDALLAAVGLLGAFAEDRSALEPLVSAGVVALLERWAEELRPTPRGLPGVRDIYRAVRDRRSARAVTEQKLSM